MARLSLRASGVFLCLWLMLSSCSRIDDTRIPAMPVNIVFSTEGVWHRYGVGGALEHKRFIKSTTNPVPADFPYTLSTYTGFGGVLLVGDIYGVPLAYDLSCPYEAKPDIRIVVDEDASNAYCPTCGSVYDVFSGFGRPLAGPAAERGYGLTRYKVVETGNALDYRIITR